MPLGAQVAQAHEADTTAPSHPHQLTATVISSSRIDLSWAAATDNVGVTGYRIYREGTQITTTANISYSDTGLNSSTTYTYTVAAYDAAGNVSTQSSPASATTQAASDTTLPSIPTGLTASAISSSQIDLSWVASMDNVGVAGYTIYRDGTLLTTQNSPLTAYSDTGLQAGTIYTYTISAFDAAGNESGQSLSTSATTTAPPSADTEVIGLVREDCTGSENCFTSLSAWEAAYGGINFSSFGCAAGDLVCVDKIAVAQIDGTWTNPDTSRVVINGWTTGPNNYIRIYTTPEARHDGKWNTGKYRLSYAGRVIHNYETYTKIDGVQIDGRAGGSQGILSYQMGVEISNCIIKNSGTGLYLWGNEVKVWNCLLYGHSTGIRYANGTAGAYFYNITLADNGTGFFDTSANNVVLKNILFDRNGTDLRLDIGSYSISVTYSATDIAEPSSGIPAGMGNRYGQAFAFIDETNDDYHLAASDTGAKDDGTDLSADANLAFSDDLDGKPRVAPWDIGAVEFAEAIPPSSDTTPPTRSNGSPTGELPSGTTETTLSLTTDESATCTYDIAAGIAYSSMTNSFSTTGGATHSTTVSGFTGGTTYTYYIKCQDAIGNMNTDDYIVTFTVASAPSEPTPPNSPSNLQALAISSSEITLGWVDNSNDEDRFKIERSTDGTTFTEIATVGANLTAYTDTGLFASTIYTYRVRAFNSVGDSGYTNMASAATQAPLDATPPSTPTNLTATEASSSQINLSWTASTDNVGVTGYRISRDGTEIDTTATTSYSDTGLAPETIYVYTVSAFDAAGNGSGQSIPASATTQASTSPPPTVSHYVRVGATGNNDGSDWVNAWTSLPATLTRGHTYYIADGNYPSYTFDDAKSGTTVIYIKKAIESNHGTDTGWESSYGDGVASFTVTLRFTTGYWEFDGQVGSGVSGHGFYIDARGQVKGVNISTPGVSNITMSHLEIEGNGKDGDSEPANDLIYLAPTAEPFITNLTFSYLYLHDSGRVPFLFRRTSDVIIEYSWIARNESTPGQHSEGIAAWNDLDNYIIRYNTWEDIEGTGIIVIHGDNSEVYGNVFFYSNSYTGGGIGNGAIANDTGDSNANWKIYNNIFVNLRGYNIGPGLSGGVNNIAENNLWFDDSGTLGGAINFLGTSHDYNWFTGSDTKGETNGVAGGSEDPFVNENSGDYHLTAGSSPINNGVNLGGPYDKDKDGNTRGADGNWDQGAYEYVW